MRLLRKFLPITVIIILIVLFNTQSNSINLVLGTGNVAIGGGGYVTGIYLHPKQRDLVYIKTDVGGFYRWNSTNQSWIPLTDHFNLEQVNYYGGEAIALDPQNPNTVYIAVGKYASDWWQHKGTIFKSTNQGKTWQKLNLDLKMGGNEPQRWTGERLAINPFDSQLLLFGSRKNGLWISKNGGKTWSQVKSFPGKLKDNLGITVITFNPSVRNQVYAVAYDDEIYQSNDLGITWQKLLNSPVQANRLAIKGNTLYVTHSSGVSKYSNGKWSNITPANNQTAFNALTINPSNSNEIIVSTLTEKALQIYHSYNQGATWQKVSGLPNGFNAPWNWSQPLAADKVNGNTFYYYSNSKLYRSDNGGASFNIVSTSIPHADWHSLKTVPLVKGELWLSLDNQGLYHFTDSGKTFLPIIPVKGAHLFSVGKAQNNRKIPTLYLYGKISNLGNGIFRSVDQGKTWKRIGDSKKPIGNDPNFMEASRQKFGLVFIGTNGRGIYYVN